jgi:acyl dehydratase
MEIGYKFRHSFKFSQKDVIGFATVTGDNNPIHLDAAYAEKSMFKKPIMHGMLGSSIFSKVFGTIFPGEGSIYLNQSLNFLRPMFVEEDYDAIFEVKEVFPDKKRVIISTSILNSEGKATISGEATLIYV